MSEEKKEQYAIAKLEEILKLQEQHLEHYVGNLKELYGDISIVDANIVKARHYIKVLKDAILKLTGLYNLEKKNKIADPVGFALEDMDTLDFRKFVQHTIMPEIISILKDRTFTFREQMSELLK